MFDWGWPWVARFVPRSLLQNQPVWVSRPVWAAPVGPGGPGRAGSVLCPALDPTDVLESILFKLGSLFASQIHAWSGIMFGLSL